MKLSGIFIGIVIVALTSGCVSLPRQSDIVCQGPYADGPVEELTNAEPLKPGMARLILKANLKTHSEGHFLWESGKSFHGKPGFPFVVVIDGKTFEWKDDGKIEVTSKYDAMGKKKPEGGEGVRYSIERKLMLLPGRHHVTLRLPSEKKSSTVLIELNRESESYTLEFKPVYNTSRRAFGYVYGVIDLDASFNGVPIKECGHS